jgi:putative acetyltransferase
MIDYVRANADEEYMHAVLLFKQYALWLNIDLSFQHFDEELLELKKMYAAPTGGIILCKANDKFIGCVGIRKIETILLN